MKVILIVLAMILVPWAIYKIFNRPVKRCPNCYTESGYDGMSCKNCGEWNEF